MKRAIAFLSLCFTLIPAAEAQEATIYEGRVIDAKNGDGLFFASITLLGQPYGTTTDESGSFRLKIYENQLKDTILISFIGYDYAKIPIAELKEVTVIKLQPNAVQLEEVMVLPLSPVEYVKRAVGRIQKNYPIKPYESIAYYKEKFTENGNFIKQEEAIIKTYHLSHKDTIKSQNQILLHRKVRNVKELSFMRDDIEKEYEKEVKKADKSGDSAEIEPPDLSMEKFFGGPNTILALNVQTHLLQFIDTNNYNEFRYSFGPSTKIFNRDIIVINYQSKGKYNHMRSVGQILIDADTYAFVSLSFTGEFVVPILIRPILFALGLRIIDPVVSYQTDYQHFDGLWYPKNFWWNINARLVKQHWFSKNERSTFNVGQVYVVHEVHRENVQRIPKSKRYNREKKMESQVFPEEGIDWFGH